MTEPVIESFHPANSSLDGVGSNLPPSPEGVAFALGGLVLMAILPIVIYAFRSVSELKEKNKLVRARAQLFTMTKTVAAMYPIVLSAALYGLYCLIASKDNISDNTKIDLSNPFLGISVLSELLYPFAVRFTSVFFRPKFLFRFTREKGQQIKIYQLASNDLVWLVTLGLCTSISAWHHLEKNWIANNLIAIAFAVDGIKNLPHLNNIVPGFILLGGLVIYDVVWVFGTDVMMTVATSISSPFLLRFPVDLFENGWNANKFTMLGLGDIIFPGLFIALLLRFDHNLKRGTNSYFNGTLAAYILGLLVTFFVMYFYGHGQPALLYLAPACIGTPLFLALIKGDIQAMLNYEDYPTEAIAVEVGKKKDQRVLFAQHPFSR